MESIPVINRYPELVWWIIKHWYHFYGRPDISISVTTYLKTTYGAGPGICLPKESPYFNIGCWSDSKISKWQSILYIPNLEERVWEYTFLLIIDMQKTTLEGGQIQYLSYSLSLILSLWFQNFHNTVEYASFGSDCAALKEATGDNQ